MNYYYSDSSQKPVGPYTLEQLRDLKYQGTITDSSFIIEEGGSRWKTFREILNPPKVPPIPATPAPLPASAQTQSPQPAHPPTSNPQAMDAGMAVVWFVCCTPIGFMQWGQAAKGWLWVLITLCTCGYGGIVAIVDYWMCFAAQQKRPLKEWEFFP